MKKHIILVLGLTIVLLAGCRGVDDIEVNTVEPLPTKMPGFNVQVPYPKDEALWYFSHNLLLQNTEKENPVLSPVSAYLALGMAGMGAEGETLEEMQLVMGKEMQEIAGDIMEELTQDEDSAITLNIANSAWLNKNLTANETWLENIQTYYGAEYFQRELSTAKTMREINGWIEGKTEGLIKDFLSEPLSEDTELALFNTIYFYGKWRSPFMKEDTKKEEFTLRDGTTKTVDMMNQFGETHLYFKNESYDGVVLPYRGEDMAFVAIKPTAGQSVRELFENLTKSDIEHILDVEDGTTVNLKLPKFDITFDKELNDSLMALGMQKAFDRNQADFSGMSQNKTRDFFISLVRQKAVVKVDEEGTEAAAVTAVKMEACSAMQPQEPIDVYFDEPFVYMIMNTDEEIPLFMGILDNPAVE